MIKFSFNLPSELHTAFQKACNLAGSNMGVELRKFIIGFVRKSKKENTL